MCPLTTYKTIKIAELVKLLYLIIYSKERNKKERKDQKANLVMLAFQSLPVQQAKANCGVLFFK